MSGGHVDRRARAGLGIFPILNKFLFVLTVCIGLGGLFYALKPEIEKYHEEKTRLRRLSLEIENQRAILERSKQELELLKTDPEYVEIIARDKMDLMKEGETVFRIDTNAAGPMQEIP